MSPWPGWRWPTWAASRAAASGIVIAVDGGEVLLIDESYNANPASMAATLKSLGEETRRRAADRGARADARAWRAQRRAARRPRAGGARRAGRPADPDRRGDGAARRTALGKARRSIASRDVDEASDALLQTAPARRRGAGQGVELGRACQAGRAGGRGRRHALPDRRAARLPRPPQPHPLHQLPRRRGERDRAADRPAARAVVHLLAARAAGQGPADPRRRPAKPPRQARHADHGRPADPDLGVGLGPAVDGPHQPLCLGVPAGHRRLRADRLPRRLRQGQEGASCRPVGQDAAGARIPHRRLRHLADGPRRDDRSSTCRSSRGR